jgi:predicted nuclease with TOPRIM domain
MRTRATHRGSGDAHRAQQADRDEIAQQLDALKHEKTALETQLEAIRAEYAARRQRIVDLETAYRAQRADRDEIAHSLTRSSMRRPR